MTASGPPCWRSRRTLASQPTGDDWSIAAISLLRAQVAALAGDVSTVAAMAAQAYRHAEAIGFDAFQVPALLLEAWVAERRSEERHRGGGVSARVRARGCAGFVDHAAFALAGLGWNAFASGDLRKAEELERQALAAAEAARSPWTAAHARVRLARVLATAGDADTAEALYRDVLEWSDTQRPHGARESLFLALAEDPGAAARAGLDDLGQAPPRDCGSVGARRDCSDAVARIRGVSSFARRREWQRGRGPWQGVGSRPRDASSWSSSDTTGGTRGDKDD